MNETYLDTDGIRRCHWCSLAPEFPAYHDTEWGFPVSDDRRLFEKLSLEGFQSGLSWRTILAKRENFRRAFHDFDYQRVARFEENDVVRLLQDAGIIRHRGKIEAVINNARRLWNWRRKPAPWPPTSGATSRIQPAWRNHKRPPLPLSPSPCPRI